MLKRLVASLILSALPAYAGTVTGSMLGPSGLPVANATITFKLQQAGLAIGTGAIAALSSQCFTSSDGTVVGLPNPLAVPVISVNYGTGTLPAGTYYVQTAYYGNSHTTLPSPEAVVQLVSQGSFTVAAPAGGVPAGASGFIVYAATTSGAELAQGESTTSTGGYTVSVPLVSGIAPLTSNNTVCSVTFNDTIIPYTGYDVSLISANGNSYPGWPQKWQLNGGPSGIVNVSQGAPLWNGVTVYPQPIVAQPLNHGPQSIAGLLNMTGYNVVNVAALGIGTTTPSWPLDVENGYINTNLGYLVAGGAGSAGQCLVSNGTFFGPGSCGTLPSLYYQHMQLNGGLYPQEPFLNFSTSFYVSDNPGSTRTDVGLLATGVTAGSYTNPNVTVNVSGQITAASNGPTIPVQQTLVITSGFCTTGTGSWNQCTAGPFAWPSSTAFTNANYGMECQVVGAPSGHLTGLFVSSKSATGFYLILQNGTADGAVATTVSEVDCKGSY